MTTDLALNRPVARVVAQHVEEAVALCGVRSVLVGAPHVKLHHLRRLDDRLGAHLDGLVVAGEFGARLSAAELERPGVGALFVATALALECRDEAGLDTALSLAQALPECRPGVTSAFGWVSAASLRGITRGLLDSPEAFRRLIGIAACDAHGVDPAQVLPDALGDPDPALRAQGLRAAGGRGRGDLRDACVRALDDVDVDCAVEAARSAVLLGDRQAAVRALHRWAQDADPDRRARAIGLLLKLTRPEQTVPVLKRIFDDEADARLLTRALGESGDPQCVPLLIERMHDPVLSRLAGESFSMIAGADLDLLDLDRKPIEVAEAGPTDDSVDEDVAMDQDDGLPWPDPQKVGDWWATNAHRFVAGQRYFVGAPPTPTHCLHVLRHGFQRQRIAAAGWRCLLQPGTPLFNTAAPAWRQQRWLAALDSGAAAR